MLRKVNEELRAFTDDALEGRASRRRDDGPSGAVLVG